MPTVERLGPSGPGVRVEPEAEFIGPREVVEAEDDADLAAEEIPAEAVQVEPTPGHLEFLGVPQHAINFALPALLPRMSYEHAGCAGSVDVWMPTHPETAKRWNSRVVVEAGFVQPMSWLPTIRDRISQEKARIADVLHSAMADLPARLRAREFKQDLNDTRGKLRDVEDAIATNRHEVAALLAARKDAAKAEKAKQLLLDQRRAIEERIEVLTALVADHESVARAEEDAARRRCASDLLAEVEAFNAAEVAAVSVVLNDHVDRILVSREAIAMLRKELS